jgi:hypothetical protein
MYVSMVARLVEQPRVTSADQCKAILSAVLAPNAGQSVQWDFNDSLTCFTHPSWSWLTGWYSGPNVQSQ